MKKILYTFIFVNFVLQLQAQQKVIDSLKKAISVSSEDTIKIKLMNQLGIEYYQSKPDSALLILRSALQMSQKINFLKGESVSLNLEGVVYNQTGNYPKALGFFFSAIKINEVANNQVEIAKNYENIGVSYYYEQDFQKTIDYTIKAKLIDQSINNKISLTKDLLNLGDTYEQMNKLDSARKYTELGYNLALKIGYTDDIATATNNLANIYSKLNGFKLALDYYRKAIFYAREANDDDTQCESTLAIAKILKNSSLYQDSCLFYGKLSIKIGLRDNFPLRVLNASKFLTDYFKGKTELDSAFHYQEIFIAAKDSLFSQEKIKQVEKLAFAEKQRLQEIDEEKIRKAEENAKNLQLTGIAVFIPSFFLFILFLSRHKTQPRIINFLGILSLLFMFEFISLLLGPYVEQLTKDNQIFSLIISVVIAAIIEPVHHKTEIWIKKELVITKPAN